jgi:hypothetical protein
MKLCNAAFGQMYLRIEGEGFRYLSLLRVPHDPSVAARCFCCRAELAIVLTFRKTLGQICTRRCNWNRDRGTEEECLAVSIPVFSSET